MSWDCLICGYRQRDGTQSSSHACNHFSTSFAIPNSQIFTPDTSSYQHSLFLTPNAPTPSVATQYNPHPSAWVTDGYTELIQPTVPTSINESCFYSSSQPQDSATDLPQPELFHFDDHYIGQRADPTLHDLGSSPSLDSGQLKCEWAGCTYDGSFTRDISLWRHIKAKHILPRRFKCHKCNRAFGRQDKLREHTGSTHSKSGLGEGHCLHRRN